MGCPAKYWIAEFYVVVNLRTNVKLCHLLDLRQCLRGWVAFSCGESAEQEHHYLVG